MEKNYSLVKKQLLLFIERMGLSKRGFYAKVGMSNGVLDKPSGVSEENIIKFISTYPDVRLEWLLLEEEPMLKSEFRNISPDFSDLIAAEPSEVYKKLPIDQRMQNLENQMVGLWKSYRSDLSFLTSEIERIETKTDKIKAATKDNKQRTMGE